jgi:multidrug efflux system membrane fusion protein
MRGKVQAMCAGESDKGAGCPGANGADCRAPCPGLRLIREVEALANEALPAPKRERRRFGGLRSSHVAAAILAGGIVGWMATGEVVVGGTGGAANAAPPPAARLAADNAPFKVRYATLRPERWRDVLTINGRMAAEAVIPMRAETAGTVRERLVEKGDRVAPGDPLCRLDEGTRQSAVARAEAALAQARFDHEASRQLQERGFAASTQLNALKAALDHAQAELDQARQELARTTITATAAGIVQDPVAAAGDHLTAGGVCVTLIDTDPIFFVGQVSERDVGAVTIGGAAEIGLISGEVRVGEIRYVAAAAEPETRTFRVEIAVENGDGRLRDGVTATSRIALAGVDAYRVQASWLALDAEGRVGLRKIGVGEIVGFVPVQILAEGRDGVWVTGPDPAMRVITLGQDYVAAGERVEPVADGSLLAEATGGSAS